MTNGERNINRMNSVGDLSFNFALCFLCHLCLWILSLSCAGEESDSFFADGGVGGGGVVYVVGGRGDAVEIYLADAAGGAGGGDDPRDFVYCLLCGAGAGGVCGEVAGGKNCCCFFGVTPAVWTVPFGSADPWVAG